MLDVVKLMEQAAAEGEEGPAAATDLASPPPPPPSPPPLVRLPSQHSALQPPRFSVQQQQGELGELRRPSLRSAGGSSSCLRRASSAAGGSAASCLVVRQGCADHASPLATRLSKRCTKALALLERLQLPGGPEGKEALPAAALRTCKVGCCWPYCPQMLALLLLSSCAARICLR